MIGAEPDATRVLIVSATGVFGGAERVLVGLAEHGRAHGLDVSTMVLGPGPLAERVRSVGGIVAEHDRGKLRDVRAWRRAVVATGRFADHVRAEVIIGNMGMAHIYSGPAARQRRIPAVWIQANGPRRALGLDGFASLVPAKRVLACSNSVAQMQRSVRWSPPVGVVYPGTDTGKFAAGDKIECRKRLGLPIDRPIVGMVGRLQEWKRHDVFLAAAAIVARARPDAYFVIVGGPILGWEGAYPARLKSMTEDLGIAERVCFAGNQADMVAWYSAFDVAVNCSDPEPFGLVITEAMSCGLPVIAVAKGGPLESIEDGASGLLVGESTPSAFADAMSRLLASAPLRESLGNAARQRVIDRFSVAAMCESLRVQLDDVLRRS